MPCFYKGEGCGKCLGTGYSGRMPIYEIMVVTPAMQKAIEAGLPAFQAARIAAGRWNGGAGCRRRRASAAGRTSLEEVLLQTFGEANELMGITCATPAAKQPEGILQRLQSIKIGGSGKAATKIKKRDLIFVLRNV